MRPVTARIISFILSYLLVVPYADAMMKERVYENVLPNGLKVLLLENHKAPVVTFQVWYRVGSRNEEWGKTGLSHMLEHMMFKGTKRVPPEEFSRIIQENGGNDNAFTSSDNTAYFENISAERVQIPIELESDRMQNLILSENDFITERQVVMEERRLRTDDNPKDYLIEQLEATAFQIQPYHWPTIGWMEDIRRFTLEDLKEYYRTYYDPANAFLVVAGDFRKAEIIPLIEKAFASIPEGNTPDQNKDEEQPQHGERRIFVKKEAQLPFLVTAYHVPNLRNPDAYALEVLSAVLSGGKSSRLYKGLVRERQLALSADTDYSLVSRDPGLFYFTVEPLPGKDVGEVEKALDQEIGRMQKEPVGKREIEKAKNQLEAAFIYGQDSLFYQAMLLAQYEIAVDWRYIDDYIPSIRKVTPEDIMRVANRYLVSDNRTTGILIPLPIKEGKPSPAAGAVKGRAIR
jgi:zinc protease